LEGYLDLSWNQRLQNTACDDGKCIF